MTQVQPFVISTTADEATFFEWAARKLSAREELKKAHVQKEAMEYELASLNIKIAKLTSDAQVELIRAGSGSTLHPERQGISPELAEPENCE